MPKKTRKSCASTNPHTPSVLQGPSKQEVPKMAPPSTAEMAVRVQFVITVLCFFGGVAEATLVDNLIYYDRIR